MGNATQTARVSVSSLVNTCHPFTSHEQNHENRLFDPAALKGFYTSIDSELSISAATMAEQILDQVRDLVDGQIVGLPTEAYSPVQLLVVLPWHTNWTFM